MTAIENIQAKVREAQKEQAEWLEDVLAGLLCNGVQREEINVQYFISDPGLTRVTVRGVPKYEHRVIVTACGASIL